MHKFIKKYQKQMLAVFMVLLMIVFIIPSTLKSGRSFSRRPIGHIGNQPVYADEKAAAASEWTVLQRVFTAMPFMDGGRSPRPWEPRFVPYIAKLGPSVAGEIEKNPDLYLLLQREAAANGISVSDEQVRTVIANDLYGVDREHPTPETVGLDGFTRLVDAVSRFLPVVILHDRVNANVKISDPMWEQTLAHGLQMVRLSIVDLPAARFRTATTAPTTQQLRDQYDKFAHVLPGSDSGGVNRLGFGYELPARVKLQYLTVPHKQVLDAVRAGKSPYDWEVDERVYYYAHQSDFVRPAPPASGPSTRPAAAAGTTSPSTAQAAATASSTQPASTASSQPTTRPFAEVQKEIMDLVMEKPAADLTQAVQDALAARLSADYHASPSTQPSTADSQSGLGSKSYLEKVALDIQKQYSVLPQITQLADWYDGKQLSGLPGIGFATADGKSFSSLALEDGATSMAIDQPSRPLTDFEKNVYIFRVTDRDPAHAPPYPQVAEKVADDYYLDRGYETALAQAGALVQAANKQGLASAAAAQNRPVISTPVFIPGAGEVPGYTTSPAAAEAISRKAVDLLTQATPRMQHPVAIVELPADRKVAVVQLAGVDSHIGPGEMFQEQIALTRTEGEQLRERLAHDYFNYKAVAARLGFVPEASEKNDAGS